MKKGITVLLAAFTGLMLMVSCSNDADAGRYSLGDRGPGGGIIFYDAQTVQEDEYEADNGSVIKKSWRYLEMAPADVVGNDGKALKCTWGESGVIGTGTGIGYGWKNTEKIKKKGIEKFPAFDECAKYTSNGCTDWFLPSKDELDAMYRYLDTESHNMEDSYWSSSEDRAESEAWWQKFQDGIKPSESGQQAGTQGTANRGSGMYCVRPVRSFL